MSHGAGVLLGLFGDVFGQHFRFLGYRRKLQRVQGLRFLLLTQRGLLRKLVFDLLVDIDARSRGSCGGQSRAGSSEPRRRSLTTITNRVSSTATATPTPTSTYLFFSACSNQGTGGGGAAGFAGGIASGFNVASNGSVSTINWSPRSARESDHARYQVVNGLQLLGGGRLDNPLGLRAAAFPPHARNPPAAKPTCA